MRASGMVVFFMLMFGFAFSGLAQVKYEKEYRITEESVPVLAKKFVDALSPSGKVKWYIDEGLSSHTVEAKTRIGQQRYSIEFDTLGNLQDVEVEIEWQKIDKESLDLILASLQKDLQNLKIIKTQAQYIGNNDAILGFILYNSHLAEITIRYEIEVSGKEDGRQEVYEYTFNEDGSLSKRSMVVFKNTDNIEF